MRRGISQILILFWQIGRTISLILESKSDGIPKRDLAVITGPNQPPLLEDTISEKLSTICGEFPARTAVKTPTSQLTYLELDQESDALALGILDLGIRNGDRVAISLGNCVPYAVISYACFKIGAIVVPLNPAYTAEQVSSALCHVEAACFVLSTEITLPYKEPKSTASLLEAVVGNSSKRVFNRRILLVDNSVGKADTARFNFTAKYEDILSKYSTCRLPPQANVKNSDLATIQFTSGTTSAPKAACLSHRNVLNNAFFVGRGMCLTAQDIICCPPPLYHCFGLVLGLLAAMTYGACVVLPSEAFDARAVLRSLEDDKPTALYGVPTMFLAELELLTQGNCASQTFSQLRTGVIGGSPIPAALRKTLHERLNLVDLANCYGLTESSPIICMTLPTDGLDRKLNTVGQMLPHTSMKIAPRDDPTKTLLRGEKGELLISGYCVMKGYWEDEARTLEALITDSESGQERVWLRSGDEAMVDEEGYIRITGRIKDIIIRGGENIYPPEIENVLLQHPLIGNASVVGIPDERYGEVIAAFVIAKDGVKTENETGPKSEGNSSKEVSIEAGILPTVLSKGDVQNWVCERLSKVLVPKHVFWVERMPLTASGKIEKYKLRELGISRLQQTTSH
ncbi:related to acyl-CoA synthetases (AMP-forming)/AMP-acid ligases II [Rhynchosporium graminicola]|uniref:Related to acyl-CoA synthetases (AMP-forming)/AMP-acid ligases II n=1 Tax=Rhynchosporium graminicola TaxID=2792576 RepID=A0A1E1JYU0_9HELO|nr:related to acyl-CoA synthetases (AMP-forming)/AMP-acid ligases II [Rhynchosporium commune]